MKEGAKLQAGDVLFYSKTNEAIKFVSPVSGTLLTIKRGAKRVITEIIIEADQLDTYRDNGVLNVNSMNSDEIKNHLLAYGLLGFH